ncbi:MULTISPECIES: hypothetical protein [unclassified Microbacterium]|uniref:hypothetical protein n=1 Tax=unclassified Microbacterium TaxID=2609290 RepID=UPI00203C9601|nr:hypothetical protein [Microbacterium sp. USTB-Y]
MDRKTVNAELRRQFVPLLTGAGFLWKSDVGRRILAGPVIHVVEVQHRPRAAVFQVNLGAHLPALGDVAGGESPADDALREYECAWRGSVVSGFRNASDAEFAYGGTAEEAAESVAFLASEWQRQSERFFGPLTAYPDGFHATARGALEKDLHPAHLLTWARVALLLEDSALAEALATQALPRVPERATSLRDELQRILTR